MVFHFTNLFISPFVSSVTFSLVSSLHQESRDGAEEEAGRGGEEEEGRGGEEDAGWCCVLHRERERALREALSPLKLEGRERRASIVLLCRLPPGSRLEEPAPSWQPA